MNHNMQILQEAAAKYGPLCVGLDTDPSYIPAPLLNVFGSKTDAVLAYNKEIIKRVNCLGIYLDDDKNDKIASYKDECEGIISTDESDVVVRVLPTNEEIMIIKDTYNLVK